MLAGILKKAHGDRNTAESLHNLSGLILAWYERIALDFAI